MIRASSAHRITTNRPFFNSKEFDSVQKEFKEKVEKKGIHYEFSEDFSKSMLDTPGLKTIAEKSLKQFEKLKNYKEDPLPDGAKTYLQELYLEHNYGFIDVSNTDNNIGLRKGNLVEDGSISLLSQHLGIPFKKNEDRISNTTLFLTGEADILHENNVRDIKSPENWKTFRKKEGIEIAYHWQLIAYCLLYNKTEAYLDYVLMPMPEEMLSDYTKYMPEEKKANFIIHNDKIASLPSTYRIKTYSIDSKQIEKDVKFLVKRLGRAKAYYDTLTYEKCMNM